MKFEIEFISVKDRMPTKDDLEQNGKLLCIVEVPIGNGKSTINYRMVKCHWDYFINEPLFNVNDCIIRAWAILPNARGLLL